MSDRLTETFSDGSVGCSGYLLGIHQELRLETLLDTLSYYEDLEEQGRLVELPCKVGDTVWVDNRTLPYNYHHPKDGEFDYWEFMVIGISMTRHIAPTLKLFSLARSRKNRRGYLKYSLGCIGKTVFPTKSEAEAALAARSGGENDDV